MNYGIKVSKKGKSVIKTTDMQDIIMSTRFPFAKIDQTNSESFKTISVSFLSNPPLGVETEIYSFDHGYTYLPQGWGLWNVEYPVSATFIQYDQGLGGYISGSGFGAPIFILTYKVFETSVKLYIEAYNGIPDPINLIGVVAKLTFYVFADDLTAQDYTV